MIRPFTFVCFLLACASGLYLYSSKHRVQVLDREIEKTVHATEELREQTRVLHAEWTLQNDPQRLQALADQFLSLKTVTPGQFTSLADLDSRLPAVPAPEPVAPESTEPVAQSSQPENLPVALPAPAPAPTPTPPPRAPTVAVVASPPPPRPAPVTPAPVPPAPVIAAATPVPHPPEHKSPPRPAVAETSAERAPTTIPRRSAVAEATRPVQASATQPTGSALGMARNASVPPPRPMPVSASQWVTNGGGG